MKSSMPMATAPTATPDFSRIVLIKAIYKLKKCKRTWSNEAQNNHNLPKAPSCAAIRKTLTNKDPPRSTAHVAHSEASGVKQ
jgi:hypothetical protein